jgi:hypothetical protein
LNLLLRILRYVELMRRPGAGHRQLGQRQWPAIRRVGRGQAERVQKLQAVNDALGESAFQEAWVSGRGMTPDEAIACAFSER